MMLELCAVREGLSDDDDCDMRHGVMVVTIFASSLDAIEQSVMKSVPGFKDKSS